jgi:hypothetical protein
MRRWQTTVAADASDPGFAPARNCTNNEGMETLSKSDHTLNSNDRLRSSTFMNTRPFFWLFLSALSLIPFSPELGPRTASPPARRNSMVHPSRRMRQTAVGRTASLLVAREGASAQLRHPSTDRTAVTNPQLRFQARPGICARDCGHFRQNEVRENSINGSPATGGEADAPAFLWRLEFRRGLCASIHPLMALRDCKH